MTRSQRVNLGFAILETLGNRPKSPAEIAAYCGCSWQHISQTEHRALRKMRARFQNEPEILDLLYVK